MIGFLSFQMVYSSLILSEKKSFQLCTSKKFRSFFQSNALFYIETLLCFDVYELNTVSHLHDVLNALLMKILKTYKKGLAYQNDFINLLHYSALITLQLVMKQEMYT